MSAAKTAERARRVVSARRAAKPEPARFDPDEHEREPKPAFAGYRPPRVLLELVRRDVKTARAALDRIDAALRLLDA